jgi:hypothetical protein
VSENIYNKPEKSADEFDALMEECRDGDLMKNNN